MRRRYLRLLLPLGLGFVFVLVGVSDGGSVDRSSFAELSDALDELSSREGAAAAEAEIAQARAWIAEGEGLQRRGKLRKAAVIRERIPSQLELIGVLAAAGRALVEAERVERENLALVKEIDKLEARRSRLEMGSDGHRATGAYPPGRESR